MARRSYKCPDSEGGAHCWHLCPEPEKDGLIYCCWCGREKSAQKHISAIKAVRAAIEATSRGTTLVIGPETIQ